MTGCPYSNIPFQRRKNSTAPYFADHCYRGNILFFELKNADGNNFAFLSYNHRFPSLQYTLFQDRPTERRNSHLPWPVCKTA